MDLETVNFVSYPAHNPASKQQPKETIAWKYTPVASPEPKTAAYSPSKRYARNISFEVAPPPFRTTRTATKTRKSKPKRTNLSRAPS